MSKNPYKDHKLHGDCVGLCVDCVRESIWQQGHDSQNQTIADLTAKLDEANRLLATVTKERDEWYEAFSKACKDALTALWDDDQQVPYVAGPDGPKIVIEYFRDQRDEANRLLAQGPCGIHRNADWVRDEDPNTSNINHCTACAAIAKAKDDARNEVLNLVVAARQKIPEFSPSLSTSDYLDAWEEEIHRLRRQL